MLTTANDLREVVRYLKKRPAGVVVSEELDKARRRLFERKKVAAYALLGFTHSRGETISLSAAGLELADSLDADAREFRRIIESIRPYRAALEWARGQGLDVLTAADVLRFWEEQHPDALHSEDDESRRGAAASFFNFCQAAELGVLTLGKRGHATRLSVDRDELEGFLERRERPCATGREGGGVFGRVARSEPAAARRTPLRVLMLHGGCETGPAATLRQMFDLIGVECCSIETDWRGRCGDEGVWPAGCDAAALVFDEGAYVSGGEGGRTLRESVLLEVGAALAVYERRAVLIGEKSLPAPAALEGLPRFGFEGESLTWEAGVELLKAFERFREEVGR